MCMCVCVCIYIYIYIYIYIFKSYPFFKRDVIQVFQSHSYDGLVVTRARQMLSFIWRVFVRASLHIRREEKPTRCYWIVYCTYNLLNMFRALLCPSSGARDYMCVVTAYGHVEQIISAINHSAASSCFFLFLRFHSCCQKYFWQGLSVHGPHYYAIFSISTISRLLGTNAIPNILLPHGSI